MQRKGKIASRKCKKFSHFFGISFALIYFAKKCENFAKKFWIKNKCKIFAKKSSKNTKYKNTWFLRKSSRKNCKIRNFCEILLLFLIFTSFIFAKFSISLHFFTKHFVHCKPYCKRFMLISFKQRISYQLKTFGIKQKYIYKFLVDNLFFAIASQTTGPNGLNFFEETHGYKRSKQI